MSSPKRNARKEEWIRNKVNYSLEKKKKPYSFLNDVCFMDWNLSMHTSATAESVIDRDMKYDLANVGALNWSSKVVKLDPVHVSRDGNCLLHSASMAMWGCEDSKGTLRDLLLMTIKNDFHGNFKKRWWCQRMRDLEALEVTAPDMINQEWDDVIRSISSLGSSALCAAVPHRFLESIHIYVLANILRRPIIILCDVHARSITGQKIQENPINGIYLPLEWKPLECCKTPLVIGYSLSHFCPLIARTESGDLKRQKPNVILLVTKDLSPLPVRYLTEEEDSEAWNLVQNYFIVKEIDLGDKNSTATFAPCAQLIFRPFNEGPYRETSGSTAFAQAPGDKNNPFYEIQVSSQTSLIPVLGMKNKNKLNKQYLSSSTASTSSLSGDRQQENGRKCKTEGCFKPGQADINGLCDECFRKFTTLNVEHEFVSVKESVSVSQIELNERATPTAPPPSFLETESFVEPVSMMSDRCKNLQCGYRCSKETYPYCHECIKEEQQKWATKNLLCYPVTAPPESNVISEASAAQNKAENSSWGELTMASEDLSTFTSSVLNPSVSSEIGNLPIDSNCHVYDITPELESLSSSNFEHISEETPAVVRANHERQNLGQRFNPKDQAFSETVVESKNTAGDTEVSAEPFYKIKCLSPFCSNYIDSSEKLCGNCIDVLKQNSKQTEKRPGQPAQEISESTHGSREESAKLEKGTEFLKSSNGELLQGTSNSTVSKGAQQEKEQRLHKASDQQFLPGTGNQVMMTRGKHCFTAGCPNFGDPVMANKCSECFKRDLYLSKQKRSQSDTSKTRHVDIPVQSSPAAKSRINHHKQQTKIYQPADETLSMISISAPIKNKPPLSLLPFKKAIPKATESSSQRELLHISMIKDDPTSAYAFNSSYSSGVSLSEHFNHPAHRSLVVTSMTPAGQNEHSIPAYQEGQTEFRKAFHGIEEKFKKAAGRCKMGTCQNYGNKSKRGYCNSCYEIYKSQLVAEREARYGEDVPDSVSAT